MHWIFQLSHRWEYDEIGGNDEWKTWTARFKWDKMQFSLRNSLGNQRKFRLNKWSLDWMFPNGTAYPYHERQYSLSSIGVWNSLIQKNSKQSIKI